jgi:long-chain acyl-CoA synthetase
MYARAHAERHPDQPCVIMAGSGETLSYGQVEARANRLAQLLRRHGLRRLDHYAIFMENNARYIEACAAGERAGLYYTCIDSHLKAAELAFIVNDSLARVLITSRAQREIALAALPSCPRLELLLMLDAGPEDAPCIDYERAIAAMPPTPIADESLGGAMLYSSGTTGRPKGVLRSLPEAAPEALSPLFRALHGIWHYRPGMVYLSPAPLYHSAPQAAINLTLRSGGTAIVMERFDPEHFLALVERHRVSHSQLVPTMFSRLLKLPAAVRTRYDVASLECAVHAAAPCPPQVKREMIAWWGPVIHEYYGATEGLGLAACDSAEWLAHPGSVGRVLFGEIHVLDEALHECATGVPGTIWFRTVTPFEYFNDPERTRQARSADGSMSTVGDIGYLDADGFLYLTDRKSYTIISGGVNVYPQECENLLITHPKVADAAVFGVPNEDLAEEVKAVVQPLPGVRADRELEAELIAFCREHLAALKCPRSVDFEAQLPRTPTGKLLKRLLRDRYWTARPGRIG